MSYAPGTGEGYVGSYDVNAERPECPDDPDVFMVRVGSTTFSWRCPQCGQQFQGVATGGLVRLSPWGSIIGAFVPKAKSEFWE
jgi:hypothetical protein